MYWYLKPREERPLAISQKAVENLDKMTEDERKKVHLQLLEWDKARGRFFYEPNDKLRKWYLQPHRYKATSAGNRAGKTSGLAIDVIMQIEGWHPLQKQNMERLIEEAYEEWVRKWLKELYEKEEWIRKPPIYARVVAPDFPNYVEKVIGPEYEKWATQTELAEIAYTNQNKRIIRWKDGSFVEFMTVQQDLKSHGGSARHVIQVDEEINQEFWVENNMRIISLNGRMLYGATAVDGVTWTEEAIFQRGEQGDDSIYCMEMSTYDNPINTDEVVTEILKQCTDETDVDIRIYGKRKRRGGAVYKMVKDENPWIVPRFDIPLDKGLLVMAIDPHPQIQHAVLWAWADYDGLFHDLIDKLPNIYNVGEIFEYGSPQELIYYIDMMETKLGRKHDYALCDPAAWQVDQNKPEENSLADQYGDLGVYVQKGSKDRQANIIRVGGLLTLHHPKMPVADLARAKGNPDLVLKLYPDARPRLFTFEDLSRVRFERRNWHFPVYRNQAIAEHDKIKPKPVDKDDHMMENEGRVCSFIEDFNPEELIQMPTEDQRTYVNDKGEHVDVSFDDDDNLEYDYKDAILG